MKFSLATPESERTLSTSSPATHRVIPIRCPVARSNATPPVATALRSMPRVPVNYQIWVRLVSDLRRDAALEDISRIIQEDAGLVVRVISFANSVHFSKGEPVECCEEAIARVGSEEIVRIVGTLAFRDTASEGLPLYSLSQHEASGIGIATAEVMAASAEQFGMTRGAAYTLGILPMLGKSFVQQQLRNEDTAVLPFTGPLANAAEWETRLLGINHGTLAAEILRESRLPENIVEPLGSYRLTDSPGTAATFLRDSFALAVQMVAPHRMEPIENKDWYTTFISDEQVTHVHEKVSQILSSLR